MDYCDVGVLGLNETNLSESPSGLGAAPLAYLPRWYAPRSSFLDAFIGTTPATKHCDGTPITDGAQMVRVDGTTLTPTPLDWNEDGNTSESGLSQDINFDGTTFTNPPNALAAAVVGFNIDLTWTPPNVDVKNVDHYTVWRITCPKNSTLATCAVSPSEVPVQVGTPTPATPLCDSGFNFCDTTTKNNVLYLYFVTATTTGHQNRGPANRVKKRR